MTGKDICWKKKKAPPYEHKLSRDEFPEKNPDRFCDDDCRNARKEGNVPTRFEALHDDREGLEMCVTILVQRIWELWASV